MSRLHCFEQHAMATTFNVIISGEDADDAYAAQAAKSAFEELARLEDELSRFRHTSDIWRLSQLSAGQSLRVSLAAWDCLAMAKAMHEETAGAFDITIGPLMMLWRNEDQTLRQPDPRALELARASVGSHRFELDETDLRVTVNADHMVFDLGAIGKGYALDQLADLFRNWSIDNVFLNAGDSTLLALGHPPDEEAWTVTLSDAAQVMTLKDRALSGSGFAVKGAHIMNPRTLQPMPLNARRTYALAPTAALSDALSTAFAVMAPDEVEALCARYPHVEALVIEQAGSQPQTGE
jgi:thiamine biosynthesis lipoprotein